MTYGAPTRATAPFPRTRSGLRPPAKRPQRAVRGVASDPPHRTLPMCNAELMKKQALRFAATFEEEAAVSVDLNERPFRIMTNTSTILAHSLVVATGADSRWLGVPGEDELKGGGVSSCATCDGFLFSGKPVVVVGGGAPRSFV